MAGSSGWHWEREHYLFEDELLIQENRCFGKVTQCLAWLYAQFRTYICYVYICYYCICGKGVHQEDWGGGLEKEGLSHELRYPSPEQFWGLEISYHSWWRELSGLNNALTQYIPSPMSAGGSHECHQLMWALEQPGLTGGGAPSGCLTLEAPGRTQLYLQPQWE